MELVSIILVVAFLVIVFSLFSDSKNNSTPIVLKAVKPGNMKSQKAVKEDRSKKNPPSPTVAPAKDPLLADPPAKPIQELGDFPTPPTTSTSSSLSPVFEEDLSRMNNGLPSSNEVEVEYRSTVPSKDSHYPKYYRKDYLSGNTLGTSEMKFAGYSGAQSSLAWSDDNVSQYPKYYKSNFEGGLTNPGSFFDQNNQYTDLTGPRTDASINDVCYKSKSGETVCLENDKLQNVPPSLITDVNQCGFLNSIGLLEYSNRINETGEKIMNGGILYENVRASRSVNETPSAPIQPQVLPCMI